MSGAANRLKIAQEADFTLGGLRIAPSAGRAFAGGDEHHVEAQTMAVLIRLVRADGATVSRDDLVEACWQGRIVSDDAIARAIAKVRAIARLTSPEAFNLETVPKVGYRLVAASPGTLAAQDAPPRLGGWRKWPMVRPLAAGLAGVAFVAMTARLNDAVSHQAPHQAEQVAVLFSQPAHSTDIVDALLNLDEGRLRGYLRNGWDPNWKLDSEGSASLHTLMLVCERNPTHDRAGLLRVARLLVDAGADPNARNGWKDTPLTIARSERYCGPEHPVVAFLQQATRRDMATAPGDGADRH